MQSLTAASPTTAVSDALPVVQAFYINLDSSTGRRAAIEATLGRTGLAFERVAGIPGAALPPSLKPYFCGPNGRVLSDMTLGEVGCHAAHLAASQRFLASTGQDPLRVALVIEDDAELPADLEHLLRETLAQLPPDWDIVRLSNVPKRAYVPVARIDGRHRLVKYSRIPGLSTAAYLINVTGAQKLLVPGRRVHPIDMYLRRPWLAGLRTYGVVPAPIRSMNSPPISMRCRIGAVNAKAFSIGRGGWTSNPSPPGWFLKSIGSD